MPFISVVIPTFNRAALLREALESVFAQTFTDYEVIVVDDGSTDDTKPMLRGHNKPLRLHQQNNRGPGAARNLGVRHAAGEYVAFLDSDDLWFPWTLQTYSNALRQGNSPAFIAGKALSYSASDDVGALEQTRLSRLVYPDYLAAGQQPGFTILTCSSVVVRRATMLLMGGFSEQNMNAEDSDVWLKLGVVPDFTCIVEPPTCGYRRHGASAVASLEKTWRGMNHMVEMELTGSYPGGRPRRKERWEIITRHVRPASLALLQNQQFKSALPLYTKTWLWNYRLGRIKYLAGFWIYFLRSAVVNRRQA